MVSGVAGGLVRGLIARGFSWPQRLSSAMVGGLTAGYATPAAMPLIRKWRPATENLETALLVASPGAFFFESFLGFISA